MAAADHRRSPSRGSAARGPRVRRSVAGSSARTDPLRQRGDAARPDNRSRVMGGGGKSAVPMVDIVVIGAGPCGLAVGVAAKRAGLTAALFDRGPVVASLMKYPVYMSFFSTAEKLEIGGVPFVTSADKPTRREALTYYRKVAEYFELDVRQYHEVRAVRRTADGFELETSHVHSPEPEVVTARHVVYA